MLRYPLRRWKEPPGHKLLTGLSVAVRRIETFMQSLVAKASFVLVSANPKTETRQLLLLLLPKLLSVDFQIHKRSAEVQGVVPPSGLHLRQAYTVGGVVLYTRGLHPTKQGVTDG